MKLILLFCFVLSFSTVAQKIDYNNFNFSLLETKVLDQINTYRKSLGLCELYSSKTLRDSVSDKTSTLNSKQDRPFHLEMDVNNEGLNSMLYSELFILTNGKCGSKNPSILFIDQSAEIISMAEGNFLTYDDLSKSIFNGWLSSKNHKLTIESMFKDPNGFSGMISCSVKKSKSNKIYTTVNFVTVGYF